MDTKVSSHDRFGTGGISPRIIWRGCEPEQLIHEISIPEYNSERNDSLRHDLVSELRHLLRRLFTSHVREILVEAVPHGYSGARLVKAQPFYLQGAGQQLIVKFGHIQIIKQEYENYREYVRDFIAGGSALALDYQHTAHLGAISYTFLGTVAHQLQEFGTFYQQASAVQVKQVLDTLFRSVCGMWYAGHKLQLLNWTEDYQKQFGYSRKQLEQKSVANTVSCQDTLYFQSLQNAVEREFSNPFEKLRTLEPVIRPTYVGITHGDLNQHNILVNGMGHPWLIDFQNTRPGHALRDVATLDTVIRLQLLTPEQATLEERLSLEDALCTIRNFEQVEASRFNYVTRNPDLLKAWETVIHLRTLAHWIIEKNPLGGLSEYALALLYSTLNSLSFTSLETVQREHVLLSASLLSGML